jgi:phage tail sheath gpL-like
MSGILVAGVPASRKTPGVALNVVLGGTGTSAGVAQKRALILGNMIAATLSNSSPSFSVTAGSAQVGGAAVEEPVFVPSADDAATLFGRGSELHRMAIAFFAQYPNGTLYACPVAEASGTPASVVLTFATTATGAFTVRLRLCGKTIDVGVDSGATVTTIAAAVADAINDEQDLPYTAQNSSGVVTVTAKHDGPRGNTLIVDAYFVSSAGAETRITASSTTSPGATTGVWSSNGTLGSEITLANGATQDTFANALAACAPTRFDRVVGACIESTNIGRIVTHLNTQAGPSVQLLAQGVCGCVDTYANAVTLATGQNAARMQIVWHHASVLPAGEVAAQLAAARLAGDGAVGGVLPGEDSSPSANLDNLELATVLMQRVVGDQPLGTEIEGCLNNGLTPLGRSPTRPGYAALVRSVTTRCLRAGTPNFAVLDTAKATVPDHVADVIRGDLPVTFAGCRLAPESDDGLPPRASLVIMPSTVRSRIAYLLKQMEETAILRNVDAHLPLLVVEADEAVEGRLNIEIPVDVIPGAHIFAGNVRQH